MKKRTSLLGSAAAPSPSVPSALVLRPEMVRGGGGMTGGTGVGGHAVVDPVEMVELVALVATMPR